MPQLPHALVTGGASGSGLATTRRLVHDGFRVFPLDRNGASAGQVAAALPAQGLAVHAHMIDLPDEAAVQLLRDDMPPLQVPVDKAGVSDERPIPARRSADFRRMP